MGDLSFGDGTNTLALTMSSPTAGRYDLLVYSGGKTGSFTTTGVDSNYTVLTGAGANDSVALQRKADMGVVGATPVAATIITGGSTAIRYTVSNVTPAGGATLSFTSTNGSNVSGTSDGTALANATSGTISGLFFTGTAVGLNQAGFFTASDPTAITTTGTGAVSVNVLAHSLPSFASTDSTSKALDFGTFDTTTNGWSGGAGGGSLGYTLWNIASGGFTDVETAGLDLYDWSLTSGDDVFSLGLTTFGNLASGSSSSFTGSVVSPGSLTSGTYQAVYTLRFRDQENLSGATNTRDLSLTMNLTVVPEPHGLALAGIGVGVVGWVAWRTRRRDRASVADGGEQARTRAAPGR